LNKLYSFKAYNVFVAGILLSLFLKGINLSNPVALKWLINNISAWMIAIK